MDKVPPHKKSIIIIMYYFRVSLGKDNFWAKLCGQDKIGSRALQPHVQLNPSVTYQMHEQN